MALLTRYWLQKVLFLLLPILIGTLVTRRTTSAPGEETLASTFGCDDRG